MSGWKLGKDRKEVVEIVGAMYLGLPPRRQPMTTQEIADGLGFSYSFVRKLLQEAGIDFRAKGKYGNSTRPHRTRGRRS